jgi:hypothetical protein
MLNELTPKVADLTFFFPSMYFEYFIILYIQRIIVRWKVNVIDNFLKLIVTKNQFAISYQENSHL